MAEPRDRVRTPAWWLALHNRLTIFVPALMSVGFVFWLSALVRDQLRRRHDRTLARRAAMSGEATAAITSGRRPSVGRRTAGLADRGLYLLAAFASLGLSLYVSIGALDNYGRLDSYVENIGWLLALSLLLSFGFAGAGVALLVIAWRWPPTGVWAWRFATRLPFGPVPEEDGGFRRPGPVLTAALAITTAAAAFTAMAIGSSRGFLRRIDEPFLDVIADAEWLGTLSRIDLLGSSLFAIVAAALLGLASFRCRVLVVAYPAALITAFLSSNLLKALVERPRPPEGPFAGEFDSFPSGHVIMTTVLAGLLPLTIAVMTHSPRVVRPLRSLAVLAVVIGGAVRVHQEYHWPSDIVGAILIGAAIVLAVEWAIAHQGWHLRCLDCQWCPRPAGVAPERQGAVPLHVDTARLLGIGSHLAAAAVAILLGGLIATRGLPADPEGVLIDPAIQRQVQLGFAGLVSIGTLVSWRLPAVGAVILALAGSALGVFASLQYEPAVAVALTIVVMIPAVLLWLSWQHRRLPGEIAALAVVTLGVLGATWFGASLVYGAIFGPTHPDSAAPRLPVDRVEWVWTGGLDATSIRATARLDDDDATARLVIRSDGRTWVSRLELASETDLVRFAVDDLEPDRAYEFVIEVDGEEDRHRGRGSFRTPPLGPTSFRFVSSGCARVGSNAAVFDAIAAEDPLLYLLVGDAHYSNIDTNEPVRFRAAFDRMLSQPGQAALYRDVPVAYVWDDHDYGPNDSDASSPSRDAARRVFREEVPSHDLVDADGAIHRAFTIGRVRFVISDTRSERTDDTMLGAAQQAWLEEELVAASRTHGLVVWVNPTPWIGRASISSDGWGRAAEERAQIADALSEGGVDNLLMVSGDAHMLAFDDGTNSGYASDRSPGFPVFHAAALDRPGGTKGGPYTSEMFSGVGQYGVIDVVDDGETIEVHLQGKTWEGEVLIDETLRFPG